MDMETYCEQSEPVDLCNPSEHTQAYSVHGYPWLLWLYGYMSYHVISGTASSYYLNCLPPGQNYPPQPQSGTAKVGPSSAQYPPQPQTQQQSAVSLVHLSHKNWCIASHSQLHNTYPW